MVVFAAVGVVPSLVYAYAVVVGGSPVAVELERVWVAGSAEVRLVVVCRHIGQRPSTRQRHLSPSPTVSFPTRNSCNEA
jgi:hypothetical protein